MRDEIDFVKRIPRGVVNRVRRQYHKRKNAFFDKRAVRVTENYEINTPLVLDDVSPETLERFRDKFDPARVAENTFKADDDIMFFVHIPKTAGMSLGRTLQENYDVFHPVAWNDIKRTFNAAVDVAYADRSVGRQVIIGHYNWYHIVSAMKQGLPVQAGSIVRDPVARLTSNYDYNRSHAHPERANFMREFPSFEAFAESEQPNVQCRQLVGLAGRGGSFEEALELLIENYTFLGLTEAFGPSLNHLGRSHGFDGLSVFESNRAPSTEKRTHVSAKTRQMLYERHADDLRLVRMLKGFYGLN